MRCLHSVGRDGYSDKVTSEQRPDGYEGGKKRGSMLASRRTVQAKRTACANALRQRNN